MGKRQPLNRKKDQQAPKAVRGDKYKGSLLETAVWKKLKTHNNNGEKREESMGRKQRSKRSGKEKGSTRNKRLSDSGLLGEVEST